MKTTLLIAEGPCLKTSSGYGEARKFLELLVNSPSHVFDPPRGRPFGGGGAYHIGDGPNTHLI